MARTSTYVGIDLEVLGGMTSIGKIIRDAWVFGIIPETETCAGWNFAGMDSLLDKVNAEWDKHGCLVCHLPPDLADRHRRIHAAALVNARGSGWSGELEIENER